MSEYKVQVPNEEGGYLGEGSYRAKPIHGRFLRARVLSRQCNLEHMVFDICACRWPEFGEGLGRLRADPFLVIAEAFEEQRVEIAALKDDCMLLLLDSKPFEEMTESRKTSTGERGVGGSYGLLHAVEDGSNGGFWHVLLFDLRLQRSHVGDFGIDGSIAVPEDGQELDRLGLHDGQQAGQLFRLSEEHIDQGEDQKVEEELERVEGDDEGDNQRSRHWVEWERRSVERERDSVNVHCGVSKRSERRKKMEKSAMTQKCESRSCFRSR